jgi:hypothetical protein
MWDSESSNTSSPGVVALATPIRLAMVPLGHNSAVSLPSMAATRSSSRRTVGSSPKTSSPTSALAIA